MLSFCKWFSKRGRKLGWLMENKPSKRDEGRQSLQRLFYHNDASCRFIITISCFLVDKNKSTHHWKKHVVVQFLGCTVYVSNRSCRPDSGRWLYKYNWANRQHHPLPVFGNPTLPIDSTEHGDFPWSRVQRWWNWIHGKGWNFLKRPWNFLKSQNTENGHASVKPLFWDFDLHILHLSAHRQVWKQYPLSKYSKLFIYMHTSHTSKSIRRPCRRV